MRLSQLLSLILVKTPLTVLVPENKEATKFVTWVELEERFGPEDTFVELVVKPVFQTLV
jgi:hypothetical protein